MSPREVGTLIVVVLKAKNLPNKRHIGKQAPYCCAYLNEEKRRTKAIKRGGQHPEWDEEFRFTLYEGIEDELAMNAQSTDTPPPLPPKKSRTPKNIKGGNSMRLQCYADDPREPDLIGEAVVDLTEVLTKGETDEWFTLMNKDKYAGEVYIELTFWSNEPPPSRKNAPRPITSDSNYGGPGNFVPANGSTSSLNGSSAHSTPSRLSVSSTNPDSHLPSIIRSSHSRAELYAPSYEQRNPVVDQLANDFGELGVMDPRRRESFPPTQTIRPTSAGFNSLPLHPNSHDQHTPANGTSTFLHDGGRAANTSPSRIPSGSAPYYASYENGSTLNHPPPPPSRQGHAGPRYSLPASSSGFVPISSPAPSSYGTMSSYSSEPSGFSGQERPPLPIPPSHPQVHANNSPSHRNGYTSYPPPLTPGPPVPPPNASHRITHSFSTPQLQTHDQYQYADPHGQTVVFPSQEYIPPTPGPQAYHTYTPATPSPPHDYALTPQHVTVSRGSRPLPQPLTVGNVPRTRHLSMAAPPSSSFPQSLHPGSSGGTNVPSGSAYQNVPPPPPLPTQYNPAPLHVSPQEPQNPGATSFPPFPTRPAQPHSNPSPVRPSLPQPPMGYHPVQPAYQPLPQPPPPPPPPVTSRHGQLPPPPPLLNATPANHSYFPGPPPWSPQVVDHSHWGPQGSYVQPASTQGDWQ
ncbi:hypothetical protein M405DRAFT_771988 [Rhizopogon salebrosus TDB-379]|nr:hypothetical protein M405DRAFT_771988 [Rhizopogon salebrosus TDB-379]